MCYSPLGGLSTSREKAASETEINNVRKRALRLYQLGPNPSTPTLPKWFLLFVLLSKRFRPFCLVVSNICAPYLLTMSFNSPARHSCVPRPQPVSYLQLRSSQRSRSVLQSSFLRRKNRCACVVRAHYALRWRPNIPIDVAIPHNRSRQPVLSTERNPLDLSSLTSFMGALY